MPYGLEFEESCEEEIVKATRKNRKLREIIEKKVFQILEMPEHYKPLNYPMNNKRRVHVAKSFVLLFVIDELRKVVILKKFSHYDYAYL
ncbi:MAG: type II toxin-antitoxin system RelE/ParE family toxin [Candidatus Micrarchaeota archaeon]